MSAETTERLHLGNAVWKMRKDMLVPWRLACISRVPSSSRDRMIVEREEVLFIRFQAAKGRDSRPWVEMSCDGVSRSHQGVRSR